MIIFPLITTWMWFEAAMAVQSLSNNTLRKLIAGPTVFAVGLNWLERLAIAAFLLRISRGRYEIAAQLPF